MTVVLYFSNGQRATINRIVRILNTYHDKKTIFVNEYGDMITVRTERIDCYEIIKRGE